MELDGLKWKTAVTRLSPSTSRVDLHGEEIHSSITHKWLIVSRERIEKQAIETVMDEDDEPDRPLDEQDALLQDLLPINIEMLVFTESPQERFRTNARASPTKWF